MSKTKLDTLKFLRQELAFLDRGGYGGALPWRPVSIFMDSPSCPNRLDAERSTPCPECQLYTFVPEQFRQETNPCHFIPLNDDGESVHSMTRQYTIAEVEQAVRKWLIAEIHRVEALPENEESPAGDVN